MPEPSYSTFSIEEAMEILGPIRTKWVHGVHNPEKPCWLDGRHASETEVIMAAYERYAQLWDRGPWESKS